MTVNSKSIPFFSGRRIPFDELSPSEFEEFVFASLQCIADSYGFDVTGKTSGPGDGGFDIQGHVRATKRLVCVQCKRQQRKLDVTLLSTELAKVAATSALDGGDVGEHRFICTGGIAAKLRAQLRNASREELARLAGECLDSANDSELVSLRARLLQVGKSPRQTAENYVFQLDKLLAWDAVEFDAALSTKWDSVLQVVERYFQLATAVREHPRPAFDRGAYVSEHAAFKVPVGPRLTPSPMPEGFSTVSANRPHASQAPLSQSVRSIDDLADVAAGQLALVIGEGGVGKSTLLELVRAHILRNSITSNFPVLISLKNYRAGRLDDLIHTELGVVSGTWKSLPDQVLLLCDGLNECPGDSLGCFFEELGPYLRRRSVACVLSTRQVTRHRTLVLPVLPIGCVRIDYLTPHSVQRIVSEELDQESAQRFVDSYTVLANRALSPNLWTPFAVLVAIRLWRTKLSLPSTLGQMLAELLRSRCDRDGEGDQHYSDPQVVIRLAGALAFQNLIVDKRLECSALEAGRWVNEARGFCVNAIGIEDMTQADVISVLVRHEFLKLSTTGQYSFGHHLVAGALAAVVLAEVWESHIETFGDAIADDAWVFASRMIGPQHLESFLEKAFNTDLMLGARVASELPSTLHPIAERFLDRAVSSSSPEIVRIQGLYALARLGSAGSIAKLRELVKNEDVELSFNAKRALAAAGDEIILWKILPEIDIQRALPMTITGGDRSIWDAAPLSTRLVLARRRLTRCKAGDVVGECLALVAYESDHNDADLIEPHLLGAPDNISWRIALRAMHMVAPQKAMFHVESMHASADTALKKAEVLLYARDAGMSIDWSYAFQYALGEYSEDDMSNQGSIWLSKLIDHLIAGATLSREQIAVVESELPRSVGNRRSRIWQVSAIAPSDVLSSYAFSCLDSKGADFGYACYYFEHHPLLVVDKKAEISAAIEEWLKSDQVWNGWKIFKALSLMGAIGFTASAAYAVSALIERLGRIREAMLSDSIDGLSPADAAVLKSSPSAHTPFHLGGLVGHLIVSLKPARKFLSDDVILSLLLFEVHMDGAEDALCELIEGISDDLIDETLGRIVDSNVMRSALYATSAKGATELRVDLFAKQLQVYYGNPSAMRELDKCIVQLWSSQTCRSVMTVVAAIPVWEEHQYQFFWDFLGTVGKLVEKKHLPIIDDALARSRTSVARKALTFWRERALESRIGLARLA